MHWSLTSSKSFNNWSNFITLLSVKNLNYYFSNIFQLIIFFRKCKSIDYHGRNLTFLSKMKLMRHKGLYVLKRSCRKKISKLKMTFFFRMEINFIADNQKSKIQKSFGISIVWDRTLRCNFRKLGYWPTFWVRGQWFS